MENLIIKNTKVSPYVNFNHDGTLKLEGKFITENSFLTFIPILNWMKSFSAEHVEFDICLQYMNTSATMQLFSILSGMTKNKAIKEINVNWFYEGDDEDHLETGEMFEDKLDNVKFNYIVMQGITV